MILIVLAVVTPANSQGSSMAFMFRSAARKDGIWAENMAGWNECMGTVQRNMMYTVCICISAVDLFVLAVILL